MSKSESIVLDFDGPCQTIWDSGTNLHNPNNKPTQFRLSIGGGGLDKLLFSDTPADVEMKAVSFCVHVNKPSTPQNKDYVDVCIRVRKYSKNATGAAVPGQVCYAFNTCVSFSCEREQTVPLIGPAHIILNPGEAIAVDISLDGTSSSLYINAWSKWKRT